MILSSQKKQHSKALFPVIPYSRANYVQYFVWNNPTIVEYIWYVINLSNLYLTSSTYSRRRYDIQNELTCGLLHVLSRVIMIKY